MDKLPTTTVDDLIERYSVFLLDAYGVLVNSHGALRGAAEFLRRLGERGKPFYVLTNDATKPPATASRRYGGFGLQIPPDRIISSGSLLSRYFRDRGLCGMPCRVLGPPGSAEYVVDAGGYLASERETFEVLVIADQEGFPFLETVDGTLSEIFRRIDGGLALHLVLPNPDLIYPKPSGYGITSGSIALVIEAAIQTRYPDRSDLRFTVLGKPKPDLFLEALGRCGTENVVMIGDQLATDIAGANAAGVDSALLLGGVSSARLISQKSGPQPTYVIASLMPAA